MFRPAAPRYNVFAADIDVCAHICPVISLCGKPSSPLSQSDPKLIPNPATLTRKSPILMHAHTHSVFLPHPRPHSPVTHTHTFSFIPLCTCTQHLSCLYFSKKHRLYISCDICYIFTVWWRSWKYCNDIYFLFTQGRVWQHIVVTLDAVNVNRNLLQSIYCKKT